MALPRPSERAVHRLFVVTLWLKALLAAGEVAGGLAAFFLTKHDLVRLVGRLTAEEFAEDPHDPVANALLRAAQDLSVGAKIFAAAYLLAHGALKLWLVVGLLRERRWYYPVALLVFAGFVGYQVDRYTRTRSPMLLAVTAIDLVVLALTWHEWR